MKIRYREVKKEDLDTIVSLEAEAFKMSLEMTKRDMIGRIENYPNTFLVAEDLDNKKVVGYVYGPAFAKRYIEDEIYFKNHPNRSEDKYQMVLGIVVDKAYRHHKIASHLLEKLAQVAQKQNRELLSLTCEDKLVPFYQLNGYKTEGKASDDIPAGEDGEPYNNMVKILK